MPPMLAPMLALALAQASPAGAPPAAHGYTQHVHSGSWGFALDIPMAWKVTRVYPGKPSAELGEDFDVAFETAPQQPSNGIWLNFTPIGPKSAPDLAIYAQQRRPVALDELQKALEKKLVRDGAKVLAAKRFKLAGHDALELLQSVGEDFWSRLIVVPYGKDRRLVVIESRTPMKQFQAFEPQVQQLLSSLRLDQD